LVLGFPTFSLPFNAVLAALAATLLLAGSVRAGGLLRVKSGSFERLPAKTASQIHPYRVAAFSNRCRWMSSQDLRARHSAF
jgi:hypothetical protein